MPLYNVIMRLHIRL